MAYVGNQPAQGLFNSGNIQDGTVDTPDLKDGAITTGKISAGAITPNKLSTGTPTWDSNGDWYLGGSSNPGTIAGRNILINAPSGQANKITFTVNGGSQSYIYQNATELSFGAPSGGIIDFQIAGGGSKARITGNGNLSVGSTSDNGPRLSVDGNSLSVSGTLYRFGDQYTHKMGGYNSQASNNGRTLFAYAYDQANWNYQYIKVIVKRGYYYESGYAEYMINCQNNSVTQVSNTNTSTSTSSFTLSHNTVNSNRKITTVSFVSPSSYHTWDFEIEFWGMAPVSWTSTPANGQIALG